MSATAMDVEWLFRKCLLTQQGVFGKIIVQSFVQHFFKYF